VMWAHSLVTHWRDWAAVLGDEGAERAYRGEQTTEGQRAAEAEAPVAVAEDAVVPRSVRPPRNSDKFELRKSLLF
jgi:hypothetical protein